MNEALVNAVGNLEKEWRKALDAFAPMMGIAQAMGAITLVSDAPHPMDVFSRQLLGALEGVQNTHCPPEVLRQNIREYLENPGEADVQENVCAQLQAIISVYDAMELMVPGFHSIMQQMGVHEPLYSATEHVKQVLREMIGEELYGAFMDHACQTSQSARAELPADVKSAMGMASAEALYARAHPDSFGALVDAPKVQPRSALTIHAEDMDIDVDWSRQVGIAFQNATYGIISWGYFDQYVRPHTRSRLDDGGKSPPIDLLQPSQSADGTPQDERALAHMLKRHEGKIVQGAVPVNAVMCYGTACGRVD